MELFFLGREDREVEWIMASPMKKIAMVNGHTWFKVRVYFPPKLFAIQYFEALFFLIIEMKY